jgi:uncharacterized protein with beta-barrel porin domain
MAFMRCSLQPSQPGEMRLVRRLAVATAVVFALSLAAIFSPASAQAILVPPAPPAPDTPSPTQVNSDLSAGAQVLNLGSNFLERLANQATNGFARNLRTNPDGGGASQATEAPRYRTWGELYGLAMTTAPQGDFVGDKRKTLGGVAGIGARLAPGVNVGFSVDQSHTAIDVPLALQSAGLDLTQLGFNASVDRGPWTWALALVHGFGNVSSSRDTGAGFASAHYGARIDGVLTELDYYWSLQQSRIVPKAAFEYVHASTGAFQEFGGLDPLAASGVSMERARLLAGAEIGHYWILDRKILDVSAYGKFVDNVAQNLGSVLVNLGTQSIAVAGIGESRYGADAGAAASLSFSNAARVYLNYDGKFRSNLTSHQGTLGLELRF